MLRAPITGIFQSANQPISAVNKAVFFDKDGTLVENIPYNIDPSLIRFPPDAASCLRLLHGLGYQLIVVSNQSGVARGYFSEGDLIAVRRRLEVMFHEAEAVLLDFIFCPHHPDGVRPDYSQTCLCRKPAPGMLTRAAHSHAIDLSASWMIGDILDDVEAGLRAGCRTILLDNGNETEWRRCRERTPDFVAGSLTEAAAIIAAHDGPSVRWRGRPTAAKAILR